MPPLAAIASYALSVAPALALLAWLLRTNSDTEGPSRIGRPDDRMVLLTAVFGAALCAPAALFEYAMTHVLGDVRLVGARFLDAFVVAALTEETLKLALVLLLPFRRGPFDRIGQGIRYAVSASLGFGLLENVAFSAGDLPTALARALTAVPMHALAGAAMGYFIGRARFVAQQSAPAVYTAGLAVAVLLHGSYDWAVYNRSTHGFVPVLLVGALSALVVTLLVRDARALDEEMLGRRSFSSSIPEWPTNITETLVPDRPETREPSSDR